MNINYGSNSGILVSDMLALVYNSLFFVVRKEMKSTEKLNSMVGFRNDIAIYFASLKVTNPAMVRVHEL